MYEHLNFMMDKLFRFMEKENHERERYAQNEETVRFWPSQASVKYISQLTEKTYIAGSCARSAFLKLKGTQPSELTKGESIMKMRSGSAIEDLLMGFIEQKGELFAHAVKFSYFIDKDTYKIVKEATDNTIKISGEFDGIYIDSKGNLVGGEIKSGYGYWFVKEQIGGLGPKLGHLLQVMLYLYYSQESLKANKGKIPVTFATTEGTWMSLLTEEKRDELLSTTFGKRLAEPYTMEIDLVKHFKFTYIDRGNFGWSAYNVILKEKSGTTYPIVNGESYSHITMESIFERFIALHEAFITDTLPACDFNKIIDRENAEDMLRDGLLTKKKYGLILKGEVTSDFQCSYCDFRTMCRELDNESSTDGSD